jgi:hypothetical protein
MGNNRQNRTDPNTLSPIQKRVVSAVMSHVTLNSAAAALGYSRSTLYAHLKSEAVREALREAHSVAYETTLHSLTQLGAVAIEQLGQLLRSDSDAVRLAAARIVLDMGLRYAQTVDIEQRIARIEAILEGRHENEKQ